MATPKKPAAKKSKAVLAANSVGKATAKAPAKKTAPSPPKVPAKSAVKAAAGASATPVAKAAAKPTAKLATMPTPLHISAAALEGAFPIVGIGASAGGLAAFEAFFSAWPDGGAQGVGGGMAFVIVQHLAPDYKSLLSELIARYTRMAVYEIKNGMAVKPNCTYVIPPNHDLAFHNGVLELLEPGEPRGHRSPIDFFFRSLAEDQRARAIGIVLSGTGSDGSQGIRAIKGEGGMVMAQTANSTQYDGMPRSAVATGVVDFVLPPEEMPAHLIAYVSHAFGAAGAGTSASGLRVDEALKKIFVLLRSQTGHDFSLYKQNTVGRRVERRMAVHQIERVEDYVQYLRKNPPELEALFRDFLIGVTHFFRDAEPFEALKQEAIVRMLSNKPAGAAIRVWVPGCSTGEEAYSIAMLLHERMEALKTHFKLTVFATDIDSRAIEHARAGVYPKSIASDVSAERRNRFFTEEPGGEFYRVNKLIRDILVFSEQSIVKDPPFSRLDLISCRNLLIYMGAELHKKLIPMFHYALNPGGILFLGTSESVGDHLELFEPLNRMAKLYQRKDLGVPQRLSLTRFLPSLTRRDSATRPGAYAAGDAKAQLRAVAERILLQEYGPVGALVDDRGDILYLHGRTGDYLEPAPGEAAMNILKMARQGLGPSLTTALHKAVAKHEPVTQRALRVEKNGDLPGVDIKIRQVTSDLVEQPLFMVTFEPALASNVDAFKDASGDKTRRGAASRVKDINGQIAALKQELRDKDEYLQTATEELETSNEELKSANEEMQSINEEMQSTNEELETSKEELQSVNEELITVNTELQDKLNDLAKANNDMNNLLAGSGVGTIFVNHQMYIQRFTPAITQVINLIASDVGRPVGHISSNLMGYSGLVEDIQRVLDTLVPKEIEVQSVLGRWFTLHIRPYRTLENVIEGAVITFSDITDTKKARAILMETETLRRLAMVMTDSRDAILVQSLNGKILVWNAAASRIYGWSEEEALSMNIRDLIPEEERDAALERARQLGEAAVLQPYQAERICKDGRIVSVSLAAVALVNESGEVYAISTTERISP